MIVSLWDRSPRCRQVYAHLPDSAPQAVVEHKEIYAACKARDANKAGASVRKNVRQTTLGILAKLNSESN
jgi:DNA-binding GntR family transcriptional regulator